MWSDILNKPKQGQAFREFRAFLMNVPTNYDDEVERLRTHADLLPREDPGIDKDTLITAANSLMSTGDKARRHYRSVLGDEKSSNRKRRKNNERTK